MLYVFRFTQDGNPVALFNPVFTSRQCVGLVVFSDDGDHVDLVTIPKVQLAECLVKEAGVDNGYLGNRRVVSDVNLIDQGRVELSKDQALGQIVLGTNDQVGADPL